MNAFSNLNCLNSYDHGLSTPLTVMVSDPIVQPATLLFVIYAMLIHTEDLTSSDLAIIILVTITQEIYIWTTVTIKTCHQRVVAIY